MYSGCSPSLTWILHCVLCLRNTLFQDTTLLTLNKNLYGLLTVVSYDTGADLILSQLMFMKMILCLMERGREGRTRTKNVGWLFCLTGCTQHLGFSRHILISYIGNVSVELGEINNIDEQTQVAKFQENHLISKAILSWYWTRVFGYHWVTKRSYLRKDRH